MTLSAWRKRNGLTQKKAAKLFGVHEISVARWETGWPLGKRLIDRILSVTKANGILFFMKKKGCLSWELDYSRRDCDENNLQGASV